MITEKALEDVKKLLKKHNQSHLLAFWEQLDAAGKQNLLAQIEQLDLCKIDNWVANYVKTASSAAITGAFAPAPSYSPVPEGAEQERKYGKAKELGTELISTGKVAAFAVAGGHDSDVIPPGFLRSLEGACHGEPVSRKDETVQFIAVLCDPRGHELHSAFGFEVGRVFGEFDRTEHVRCLRECDGFGVIIQLRFKIVHGQVALGRDLNVLHLNTVSAL